MQDLELQSFLLVSTQEQAALQRVARRLGFGIIRETTQEASLRQLGKNHYLGVLFDADHAPVELLEFALNLSDAAPKTPVLVFGDTAPDEKERTEEVLPHLFLSATTRPHQTLVVWRTALNASGAERKSRD
jgi:hypothetical protein